MSNAEGANISILQRPEFRNRYSIVKEAWVGFEPANDGFANHSLRPTWAPRLVNLARQYSLTRILCQKKLEGEDRK
jgi:hypothetical protein